MQGVLSIEDSKLHYEVAGQGERTLVFSHAGFVDSRMWDPQWDFFAQRYRVVRYDLRGYGQSDPLDGPICRREDLYQLVRHLGIEKAAFIGCSLSGEIALDFALEHPGMVGALVIVSAVPSGFQMQGEPPPNLLEMIAAMQQGDLARVSELQLRLWIDGPFRASDQVDPALRKAAAEMNRIPVENQTWAKADSQPLCPLNPPAATRLGEIQVPTLIVAGALDNPEILRAADFMEVNLPTAQKIILPDSAHLPNMEKPAEFNRAVLSFLTNHSW